MAATLALHSVRGRSWTDVASGRGIGEGAWALEGRGGSDAITDAALLASAVQGDRAALALLYDRYAAPAYSLAVRLVGAAPAEDIVHDTFVALVERPSTFDPARGSFRAWFMTSVHRRCLTLLRSRQRLAGEASLPDSPDPDPEPSEVIAQRLQDATVRAALDTLAAPQREALVLAYYGGLSQTALSARLGVPLGTVKARMRRGLLALRGILQGEQSNGGEGVVE